MHLEVSFRNIGPRDEVRRRADALFKKLERFLDAAAQGQLTITVERNVCVVEAVITSRGQTFKIVEEDADLRTALDRTFHGVENQLRRSKEKRTNRKGRGDEDDGFEPSTDTGPPSQY